MINGFGREAGECGRPRFGKQWSRSRSVNFWNSVRFYFEDASIQGSRRLRRGLTVLKRVQQIGMCDMEPSTGKASCVLLWCYLKKRFWLPSSLWLLDLLMTLNLALHMLKASPRARKSDTSPHRSSHLLSTHSHWRLNLTSNSLTTGPLSPKMLPRVGHALRNPPKT